MSSFTPNRSSNGRRTDEFNSRYSSFQTPSDLRRRTLGGQNPKNIFQSTPKPPSNRSDPSSEEQNGPLIPLEIIDAPSQRLCITAFYVCLWAWRIHDFYAFVRTDGESLWLFLKWLSIDSIFLFSLPSLRIPWMEWPPVVTFGLFMLHAVINAMFMFKTGLPLASWIVAISKALWGRELGLSDRRVNPNDILFNSSLILGKQVVHILPEGSAILNPEGTSFCLSSESPDVYIPLQINQTNPISLEFVRFDFDKAEPEIIVLSNKETKKLVKESRKLNRGAGPNDPLTLRYNVQKTGVYRLKKVLDESKLEVRPRLSDTYVVHCPQAQIKHSGDQLCKSDLSDLSIELIGTPPFRIKYRRTVNDVDTQTTLDGIQPDNFTTPFQTQNTLDPGVTKSRSFFNHARQRIVAVPINETLQASGVWSYIVEEIQDGLSNTVNYVNYTDEYDYTVTKPSPVRHSIVVRNRPKAYLTECNPQVPLMVAQGRHTSLPVGFGDISDFTDPPLTLTYTFTPEAHLLSNGDHNPAYSLVHTSVLPHYHKQVLISEPGLYSLASVSSIYCNGDIIEPASCNLQNSPQPDLIYTSEKVYDTCAAQSIGLRVHIRLIGTPPFTIHYEEVRHSTGTTIPRSRTLREHEHQTALDLIPRDSGSYSYVFTAITDAFYREYSIEHKQIVLNQTVEPVASAFFDYQTSASQVCLDDSIRLPVELGGLGPWDLEYDVSFGNKRTKMPKITNIQSSRYVIDSGPLRKGGEYTFALSSVVDTRKCPSTLDVQLKVNVRMSKPKVSFKQLQGQWSTKALDGNAVPLPLALSGNAPFTLSYRNVDEENAVIQMITLNSVNDALTVNRPGTYELVSFQDSSCPGVIDPKAYRFEVSMVPRPSVRLADNEYTDLINGKYTKKEICEGDEDFLKLYFSGHQPFSIQYEERHSSPAHGRPVRKQIEHIMEVASVRMDSTSAGEHEYKFFDLLDYNYPTHSQAEPLIVRQTVHSRPSAQFVNPGRTYRYCASESSDDQVIPITLTGVAPFALEIEIRHSSYSKPERLTFRNIETNKYNLRLPSSPLRLGNSNIIIRSVADGRGCQSRSENSRLPSSKVQVSLHEAPSITPLESQSDYCVGERISFSLSGKPPFTVFLSLNGREFTRTSRDMTFSRVADEAGTLQIVGVKDSVSMCKTTTSITKRIHPLPAVRVSQGRDSYVDIHEGSEADILFDFDGTAPFEFTYVRSSIPQKGRRGEILETHMATSYQHSMRVKARDEGAYEVIAIKDKFCSYTKPGIGRRVG